MSDNPPFSRDAPVIALVSAAHGMSHFYQLMFAPIFTWLMANFGLSWTELGAMMTVFFVISGLGQILAGFVVDKIGAWPILMGCMALFIISAMMAALAPNVEMLFVAVIIAGVANAPFHPVDFSIFNARVHANHLGHAFAAHGLSGNIGWALAPIFMAGIAGVSHSWRMACVGAGVLGIIVFCFLYWGRGHLQGTTSAQNDFWTSRPQKAKTAKNAPFAAFSFLKIPALWVALAFFAWTTVALTAIQSFSAPILVQMYAAPVAQAALAVTGFMLLSAAGMVAGGFLVARRWPLERTIAASQLASAACLAAVAMGWWPAWAAWALVCAAGLGHGLAAPSRDMLVKSIAPPGATARVYGTVYAGFDVGFSVAAPIFGFFMDKNQPSAVLWSAALAWVLAVMSAAWVANWVKKSSP